MHPGHALLAVARAVGVAAGAVLVVLTGRAYRRRRSRGLLALLLGIASLTAGVALAGVLSGVGLPPAVGAGAQNVLTAAGLLAVLYSLYGPHARGASAG